MSRAEVATPTFSAIDQAENPLDRRALVSLKKQLEIDQPNNKLLKVSYQSLKQFTAGCKFTIRPEFQINSYPSITRSILQLARPC